MAKSNHKDKKSLRARFLAKYRFVVLNENTFEEILSYKLSRFNVFMIISISAIILIGATYTIIALSPPSKNTSRDMTLPPCGDKQSTTPIL